jgi:hypothetical protein
MYRLAWIIAGCVAAYIGSGYIAGFKSGSTVEAEIPQKEEGGTAQ